MTASPTMMNLIQIRRAIVRAKTIVALRDAINDFQDCKNDLLSKGSNIQVASEVIHIEFALALICENGRIDISGTPAELNVLWKSKILPRLELLRSLLKRDEEYEKLMQSFMNSQNQNLELTVAEFLRQKHQEQIAATEIIRKKRRLEFLRKQATALGIKDSRHHDEAALVSLIQSERQRKSQEKRRQREAELRRNHDLEKQRQKLHAQRLGIDGSADPDLSIRLLQASRTAIAECIDQMAGYMYFKVWVLSDGRRWYKLGITNDPSRRDAEQNVLPVPAETLKLIKLSSTDLARTIESTFHRILEASKIKGAGNRELFDLRPSEVMAIISIMQKIELETRLVSEEGAGSHRYYR